MTLTINDNGTATLSGWRSDLYDLIIAARAFHRHANRSDPETAATHDRTVAEYTRMIDTLVDAA